MRVRFRLCLLVAAVIAIPGYASAQTPPLDGAAILERQVLSQQVSALSKLDALGPNELTLFTSEALDRKSAGARDLLTELAGAKGKPVRVSMPDGSSYTLPPPSADGRQFLEVAFSPLTLDALWLNGTSAMRQLIWVYQTSVTARAPLTNYVSQKLLEQWNVSNTTNAYGPLRDQLAQAFNQIKTLSPNEFHDGRELLYDAARNLDRFAGDSLEKYSGDQGVPNYIYNYLKP